MLMERSDVPSVHNSYLTIVGVILIDICNDLFVLPHWIDG